MTNRKTLQVLALIGVVVCAAAAYVAYRISAGGADDAAAGCWVSYLLLSAAVWAYFFMCITRCERPSEADNPVCAISCTVRLIIIQLVLLIAFILCLIGAATIPL